MDWKLALCGGLALAPICLAFAEDDKAQAKEPPKPKLAAVEGFAYDGTTINSVGVRDIEKSKSWYRDVLGCSVFYELPEQGWCELTTPCAGAVVGLNEDPDAKPSPVNAMSFGVKDVALAQQWLVKKQAKLEGDVIEIPGVVKLLYFHDPDGNRLMFYQPTSAR